MPSGQDYSNVFNIDSSYRKEGYIYVTCKMNSTLPVNKFKHGAQNIMDFLKSNDLFLQNRKFSKPVESRVGFFTNINPKFYSRDRLIQTIQSQLLNVALTGKEKETLSTPNEWNKVIE